MSLWGGRFGEPMDQKAWRFTVDTSDRRLLIQDIEGSMAHVSMLETVGLVSASEAKQILEGLRQIDAEARRGDFRFADTDEDVHTAVARRLAEISGDASHKLHTGRSRNDQAALDLRLYLVKAGGERMGQIKELVGLLADQAEELADLPVPSYTHLQQAQPVSAGHHLAAYAWMLLRDADRFADALRRVAVSPLGAGAGGGTSLPIDPHVTAQELGLPQVFDNSLDAVASRDFAAEYAFCCAQTMAHLSRLAEDVVLWTTAEFGWASLPDGWSTGSSALPHKRNPDVFELIRGRASREFASVLALLTLQKGLPLSYNRDLQEDKGAVFGADDTLAAALEALVGVLPVIRFHPLSPSADTMALDLAEMLVERGVPFRMAHETVGRLVADLASDRRTLVGATDEELSSIGLSPEDVHSAGPVESMARRTSHGGGSPASVRRQVADLRRAVRA